MSWRKPHYNCTAALKKAQVCAQHVRRLTQGPFFPMIIDLSLTVAAYLIGSLSAAILICRLLGLPDPRPQGSGNPGATTVLRFGGKKAAALVLLGASAKGLAPVLLAKSLQVEDNELAAVGLAALFGHLYPLIIGYLGGIG